MPLAHKERFDAANGKAQHALMMGPGLGGGGGGGAAGRGGGGVFFFFLFK
jgi:hypothetical protein